MAKAAQEAVKDGVTPTTEITETQSTTPEVVEEPTMSQEEFLNERVPFKAIWDGEKYKDDIVVTLNGKNWVIQRGVEVMIPRYVLFAIYDSEDQKIVAMRTSQLFEQQYKRNVSSNMM